MPPMPPIPPPGCIPGWPLGSGLSATIASVVISSPATEAASCSATRTTFVRTDGLGPLLTLGYVDGDALPFRQAHDAGALQCRSVHEDILSALIRSNKAKPLI